ncbi:MAG TPA: hypothetical protein VJ777_26660 [Mycobacterium sp.]|nr:hypothetical protein [Mycobacterium sp.]
MAEFMRSSDAFSCSMERDPALRSTIVTLVLLDRSPDWGQIVERFDRLCRTLPIFRQKVVRRRLPPHRAGSSIPTSISASTCDGCLVDGLDEVLAVADGAGPDTERGQP